MIRFRILLFVSVLLLSGCVNAIKVYEDGNPGEKKIKGIPFFTKTVAYKQTTAYQRYKLKLTLTRSVISAANDKPKETRTYVKTIGNSGQDTLAKLEQSIVDANIGAKGVTDKEVLDLFDKLPSATNNDFILDPLPILNTVEQVVVVDYSKKYYLNAPLPWFGNGSVSGELNADGSLSKGSSNVSTGLSDILKDVLPIKEFLSAKLQLPAPKGALASGPKIELQLALEKIGNIYEFTAIHKKEPRLEDETCPQNSLCKLPPIKFAPSELQFVVKPIGSAKNEEENKNKIKIEGNVIMPEK